MGEDVFRYSYFFPNYPFERRFTGHIVELQSFTHDSALSQTALSRLIIPTFLIIQKIWLNTCSL